MSMTIAVYGNKPRDPQRRAEVIDVMALLTSYAEAGVTFMLEERYSNYLAQYTDIAASYPIFESESPPATDLVMSIGGDGTFLRTANSVGALETPIIGINSGHLGYLAAAQISDMTHVMEQVLSGKCTVESRSVLAVSSPDIHLKGHPFALNEVALLKQDTASMITVSTRLSGSILAEYRADGLIISTPTGSTGYNLSVGGPIVSPAAPVWIISPIAAHSLAMRPLVVSDSESVDTDVRSRSGSFLLSIDGKSQVLDEGVRLHIERAPWQVNVVHLPDMDFPLTLRSKLLWGV